VPVGCWEAIWRKEVLEKDGALRKIKREEKLLKTR
jgi:hypothetical protein